MWFDFTIEIHLIEIKDETILRIKMLPLSQYGLNILTENDPTVLNQGKHTKLKLVTKTNPNFEFPFSYYGWSPRSIALFSHLLYSRY